MKAQVAAPVTVNCFLLLAAVVVKPQKVLLAGNLLNFIVAKFFFMTEVRPMLPEHWEDVKKIYEEGIVTGNATFQTSAPKTCGKSFWVSKENLPVPFFTNVSLLLVMINVGVKSVPVWQ